MYHVNSVFASMKSLLNSKVLKANDGYFDLNVRKYQTPLSAYDCPTAKV